jgi:hypothetical protein
MKADEMFINGKQLNKCKNEDILKVLHTQMQKLLEWKIWF